MKLFIENHTENFKLRTDHASLLSPNINAVLGYKQVSWDNNNKRTSSNALFS